MIVMTSTNEGARVTLDTHILVYAVDESAGERFYQAQHIIEMMLRRDCVLTLQALAEFYFTVTRKGKLPQAEARLQVEGWQTLFPTVIAKPATLARAISTLEAHQLSFWDALLWATARDSGVALLLSEDFQNGQTLEGVRIINPFLLADVTTVFEGIPT